MSPVHLFITLMQENSTSTLRKTIIIEMSVGFGKNHTYDFS